MHLPAHEVRRVVTFGSPASGPNCSRGYLQPLWQKSTREPSEEENTGPRADVPPVKCAASGPRSPADPGSPPIRRSRTRSLSDGRNSSSAAGWLPLLTSLDNAELGVQSWIWRHEGRRWSHVALAVVPDGGWEGSLAHPPVLPPTCPRVYPSDGPSHPPAGRYCFNGCPGASSRDVPRVSTQYPRPFIIHGQSPWLRCSSLPTHRTVGTSATHLAHPIFPTPV